MNESQSGTMSWKLYWLCKLAAIPAARFYKSLGSLLNKFSFCPFANFEETSCSWYCHHGALFSPFVDDYWHAVPSCSNVLGIHLCPYPDRYFLTIKKKIKQYS